jgi:hypothetical protein
MDDNEYHRRQCEVGKKKMDVHSREQSIAAMTPYDRRWFVVMEVKMVGQLNSATKFWSKLAVGDLLHSANGIMPLLPKRRTTIGQGKMGQGKESFFNRQNYSRKMFHGLTMWVRSSNRGMVTTQHKWRLKKRFIKQGASIYCLTTMIYIHIRYIVIFSF